MLNMKMYYYWALTLFLSTRGFEMQIHKCVFYLIGATAVLMCNSWQGLYSSEKMPSVENKKEYQIVFQSVPRTTESLIFSQGQINTKHIYPDIADDVDERKPESVLLPYNGQQMDEKLYEPEFVPLSQIIIAKEWSDVLDSLVKVDVDKKEIIALLKRHLNNNDITTIHASARSHFYPRVSLNKSHAIEFQTNKQSFPESDYCRFLLFNNVFGQKFFNDLQKLYAIQPSRSLNIQDVQIHEYSCRAIKVQDASNGGITYKIWFGQLSPTLFVYGSNLEFLTEIIHLYKNNQKRNSNLPISNMNEKTVINNSLFESKEYRELDKSSNAWGIRIYREEASKKYEKIISPWEKNFSGMGFEYKVNEEKENFLFKIYTNDTRSKEIAEKNLLSPRYFQPNYFTDRIEIPLRSPKEGEVPQYRPSNGLSDNQNLTHVAMTLLLDNLGW